MTVRFLHYKRSLTLLQTEGLEEGGPFSHTTDALVNYTTGDISVVFITFGGNGGWYHCAKHYIHYLFNVISMATTSPLPHPIYMNKSGNIVVIA